MSERATPETDAKASPHIGFYSCATVPANFARALAQERDEARELLASEKITRNHIIKRSIEVERERDEAREELKHITEYGTEEINAAIELRQKLAQALIERDEAMGRLHPARALEWLRVHYQAWFGDRTEWSDDIADRFYKDTATLTLFCQNFKFSKEAVK